MTFPILIIFLALAVPLEIMFHVNHALLFLSFDLVYLALVLRKLAALTPVQGLVTLIAFLAWFPWHSLSDTGANLFFLTLLANTLQRREAI